MPDTPTWVLYLTGLAALYLWTELLLRLRR